MSDNQNLLPNAQMLEARLASGIIYAYSPSAKVQQLESGNFLITITDKSGTTTAEIPAGGKGSGVSILSKTKEEWDQQPLYKSEKDVLYVYTDYTSYEINNQTFYVPGLKIGDGETLLISLPFLGGNSKGIDYDQIQNKPKINEVSISGSLDSNQLQLQRKMDTLSNSQIEKILYFEG